MCVEQWGKVIRERLDILESWAHKQGLELAAECHLAKINQCADFLQVITNKFLQKKTDEGTEGKTGKKTRKKTEKNIFFVGGKN